MTYAAFDYADRDRNPVLILADGVIGTMMEPVVLPGMKSEEEVAALKASKHENHQLARMRDIHDIQIIGIHHISGNLAA